MRVKSKTIVNFPYKDIIEYFNSDLFQSLSPPVTKVELKVFEMNKAFGRIDLYIHTPFSKVEWKGKIISYDQDEKSLLFTDIGEVIPRPLDTWVHHHKITKHGNSTKIEDDIHFATTKKIYDLPIKFIIKTLLFLRKPKYTQYYKSIFRDQKAL